MKVHPRQSTVEWARLEIEAAIVEAAGKHELTDAERLEIVTHYLWREMALHVKHERKEKEEE